MRIALSGVVAVTLAVLSLPGEGSAQLTRTDPDCDYWMGVNILNQFTPQAQACAGAFEGNDAQLVSEIEAEIVSQGWAPDGVDYAGGTDAGETDGPFSYVGDGPEGVIIFDSPLTGDFVFVLKVSNQFSLYLFRDLMAATQLAYYTFGTSVNGSGSPQGLSHAGLYAVVPEPSTWVMMATGLLALGFVAWRRREEESEVL